MAIKSSFINNVGQAVMNLFWPPTCAACPNPLPLCDEPESLAAYLCPACQKEMETFPQSICFSCGRPFWQGPSHLCGDCLGTPPPFQQARQAALYQGPVAHAIDLLKYHGALYQLKFLKSLALPRIGSRAIEADFDLIIPMPISPKRLRKRGFNQAWELCRSIYSDCSSKFAPGLLLRLDDNNLPQASLSAKERRNTKFIFKLKESLKGQRILLFDDVYTTGSTVKKAAKFLRQNGASAVIVTTLARTVLADWRPK